MTQLIILFEESAKPFINCGFYVTTHKAGSSSAVIRTKIKVMQRVWPLEFSFLGGTCSCTVAFLRSYSPSHYNCTMRIYIFFERRAANTVYY